MVSKILLIMLCLFQEPLANIIPVTPTSSMEEISEENHSRTTEKTKETSALSTVELVTRTISNLSLEKLGVPGANHSTTVVPTENENLNFSEMTFGDLNRTQNGSKFDIHRRNSDLQFPGVSTPANFKDENAFEDAYSIVTVEHPDDYGVIEKEYDYTLEPEIVELNLVSEHTVTPSVIKSEFITPRKSVFEEQTSDYARDTKNGTHSSSVTILPTKVLSIFETFTNYNISENSDNNGDSREIFENYSFNPVPLDTPVIPYSHQNRDSNAAKSLDNLSDEQLNVSPSSDEKLLTYTENLDEKVTNPLNILKSGSISPYHEHSNMEITSLVNKTNLYPSFSDGQEKSVSKGYAQENANLHQNFDFEAATPSLSSNIDHTPLSSDLFTFDDFMKHTQLNKGSGLISENPELKSEIIMESTSTVISNHQTLFQDSTEPAESGVSVNVNKPSGGTEIVGYDIYKMRMPKNCSRTATFYYVLKMFNLSANNKLTEEDGYNLECDMQNLNLTFDRRELINILIELIKFNGKGAIDQQELLYIVTELSKSENVTNETFLMNDYSNSTSCVETDPKIDQDGVYVPKMVLLTLGATALALLICVGICMKVKCRKSSSSLDLSDIPHLNLKPEYHLTPIPRPSISFPDSNRDFLRAYSNETYNRSRMEDTILNQHHFTNTSPNAYEMADKDCGSKQEMHTFSGRKSGNKRSDYKSSSSHEYASADGWDRRQEMESVRKYPMDHPNYRKW